MVPAGSIKLVQPEVRTVSTIAFDEEPVRIFPQEIRIFLVHLFHVGHARSSPQRALERTQLRRTADGVDFHSSVVQISNVSADTQASGRSLREKAITHTLYPAGHVKSLGLCLHGDTSRTG